MEENNKNYNKTIIMLLISFFCLIVTSCAADNSNDSTKKASEDNTPIQQVDQSIQEDIVSKEQEPTTDIPKHEIIYTLDNERYDGGINYYVLIDPVELDNNNFKEDIKDIIKSLVKEKGTKISVEIHDNKDSLIISYKEYGDLSLGRLTTKEEDNLMATHLIATYNGELKTDLYFNTLYFFIAASSNNPTVEKYISTIEFNPNE